MARASLGTTTPEITKCRWSTESLARVIAERSAVPGELPEEMAISAVTLAELSAGPHQVRPGTEPGARSEAAGRARRLDVLQQAGHEFDPVPFDSDAARAHGRVTAAAIAAGRNPAAGRPAS